MAKRTKRATAKQAAPQDTPAFTYDASGDDFDAPPPDDDAPLPDHEPWEEIPDWQATDSSADLANGRPLADRVEADLRVGGALSRSLPGYEERKPQIIMARKVAQALEAKRHLTVEASTGTGKALDVDTPIPTATGWTRMGDLVAGDIVFDDMGQPARVVSAFDILNDRTCYNIQFSDGSSLVADSDHEWVTYTCTDRSHAARSGVSSLKKNFVTLEQLHALVPLIEGAHDGDTLSASEAVALIEGHSWTVRQAGLAVGSINTFARPACYPRRELLTAIQSNLTRDYHQQRRDGRVSTLVTTAQMAATLLAGEGGAVQRANHAIAVARPLSMADANLSVDPYFLGVWLGDGNSNSNQITTADPEICVEIAKANYTVRSLSSSPLRFAVDDENGKAKNRWQPGMTGRLRSLGLIQNKHIPMCYLRSSERQRRALLAGLLDTDGTVNRHGAVELTTTNARLADDAFELICSLGFRASVRRGRAMLEDKDCGPKWTLGFTTNVPVFRLPRKLEAQRERLRNFSPGRNLFRYVVSVKQVASRPVRCIQVDSPSHMYLAGRSMIPTHNSLAYLLPIVRSGKVGLLSTANKALQEQLFYKDIPFTQRHVQNFSAALVKGMGNYLCLDRYGEERAFQALVQSRGFSTLERMIDNPDWDGDLDQLPDALPSDVRGRVAADSDQCAWRACPWFKECYVRQMRDRARDAQVIVVNHTLLLLDSAMGGFLLPERDVVVIDEAHHLEEEATRAYTIAVTPGRVTSLLNLRKLREIAEERIQREVSAANAATWEALLRVVGPIARGRQNLRAPLPEGLRLADHVEELALSLQRNRPLNLSDKDEQLFDKLVKRARTLASDLRKVFSVADTESLVYYVEYTRDRRGVLQAEVSAAPLGVASLLGEKLFDRCETIATSATLAVDGDFSFFRSRVGLERATEVTLPYAFDYQTAALLYLPRLQYEPAYGPASDPYLTEMAGQMRELVEASRGRAFLLFSSLRALEAVYGKIGPGLELEGYVTLVQGRDFSRAELLRQFREGDRAILFGLKSFWEGVDVPGEALSLVVIDKMPFDPPDDPVQEARVSRMKAEGANWFGGYVLPTAILRLKQGVGRLIRSHEDRGVMAILDKRIYTKSYGRQVMLALPPARRTERIEDVRAFFALGSRHDT